MPQVTERISPLVSFRVVIQLHFWRRVHESIIFCNSLVKKWNFESIHKSWTHGLDPSLGLSASLFFWDSSRTRTAKNANWLESSSHDSWLILNTTPHNVNKNKNDKRFKEEEEILKSKRSLQKENVLFHLGTAPPPLIQPLSPATICRRSAGQPSSYSSNPILWHSAS